jgi:hypothetical protein
MNNSMKASHKNYSFLIIFSLIILSFNSNYVFAQKKGKIDYDEKFEEKNGMIRVKAGNKFGYLSAKGKTVIEPIYEYAEDFDENGLAIVKSANFELINKEGLNQLNGSWTGIKYYQQFKRYVAELGKYGHYIYDDKLSEIKMEDKFIISDINTNGIGIAKNVNLDYYILVSLKTGLIDSYITYDKIYSEKNGYRTYERKVFGELECGYFDANGKLMEEVYDNAYDYSPDGLAVVERDGMFAYIDLQGKLFYGFTLNFAKKFINGKGEVIDNGKPGFVNLKGEFIESGNIEWTEIGEESNGLRKVVYLGKVGFINKENKLQVPLFYDATYGFKDGVAGIKQAGKFGYIDMNGKVVIPIKYDFIENVNDGMILVREGKLYGYYSSKGVLISKIEFDKAENFSGGFANVNIGEKSGKIDKTGKITWDKSINYTLVNDKTKWAEEEKLKNVADAKTTASLPSGSTTGLQISKNSVSIRSIGYYMVALGYKNGYYFGPATNSGDNYGVLFNQDVRDQDKSGLISKVGVAFRNIKEDKSGKIVGIATDRIQEFEVLESDVILGKWAKTDLDVRELCITTNDLVVVLATDKDYKKELYIIIWDRKNMLVSTFLIHDGNMASMPKIAATGDGNVVVAFDAKPDSKTFRTTYEKIDVNTTLKTSKLKSLWKRTYSAADKYQLTDLIVDSEGYIVSVFKSDELQAEFTDKDKTKFEYRELGIVKCNSKGEDFRSHVQKYVTPDFWGRSSEGKLEMRSQDNIYFSAYENPKILENPYGPGYIVCTRFSYGLWVWSAEYQSMNTAYKAMYADQPAFAFIDDNSLQVSSVDFIETTIGGYGHDYSSYKLTNQLGKKWDIDEFQYNSETNEFVIVENFIDDSYKSKIWTFTIKTINDWSGDYVASSDNNSTANTAANSNTSTKTNNSSASNNSTSKEKEFTGNVYFKYDMMGSNSAPERLYIHYGSNGAYKVSTTKGSAATVKCQKGKVYYSLTGEKSDMKEFMEMTVDDCGKTFKYTEFK